jgi:hypothetical protein
MTSKEALRERFQGVVSKRHYNGIKMGKDIS